MGIRFAKWDNHPILGNLELDFTNSSNETYHTIVIAGENGTGKTAVLESLAAFGSNEPSSMHGLRILEIDGDNNERIAVSIAIADGKKYYELQRIDALGKTKSQRFSDSFGNDLMHALDKIRKHGIVYSKARSGFSTQGISAITLGDTSFPQSMLDQDDNYTPVKQMLVNLNAQDEHEYAEINKREHELAWELFRPKARLNRFEQSFNDFFDDIQFDKIEQSNGSHQVLFTKFGKSIPIDSLSTGEKQIVYRGAFLLDGSTNMNKGIALVDEPELSLHPQWQKRILSYYRGLFPILDETASQLIVATHSGFVIEEALGDTGNCLVIALKNKQGSIVAERVTAPYALQHLSAAEINYRTFGIASTDYHNALFGNLQMHAEYDSVISCDRLIMNSQEFVPGRHSRRSEYRNATYETLPTYIRNVIHHPSEGKVYTPEELQESISLMQDIARSLQAR